MHIPRVNFASCLLPNGNVLVIVGATDNAAQKHINSSNNVGLVIRSTELYNRSLGKWTKSAAMHFPRYNHVVSLLSNRKVLVTGGKSDDQPFLQTAELYDPLTKKWSIVDKMPDYRSDHTTALLSNGKVLITGGYYGSILLKNVPTYMIHPRKLGQLLGCHRLVETATGTTSGPGPKNLAPHISRSDIMNDRALHLMFSSLRPIKKQNTSQDATWKALQFTKNKL